MLIKHDEFLINHNRCDFIEVSGTLIIYNFTYGTRGLMYKEPELAQMAFEKIVDYLLGGKDFCDVSPSVISARAWSKHKEEN